MRELKKPKMMRELKNSKMMRELKYYLPKALIILTGFFISCRDEDLPPAENEEEIIDKLTLTFEEVLTKDAVVVEATDPDGPGALNFEFDTIKLQSNSQYTLTIKLENTTDGENITDEIMEESNDHMFFFSFDDNIFSSPEGNGNVDNRLDEVDYEDEDESGYPLGLETSWSTVESNEKGKFRIVLKHQPDIKSATSSFNDGQTDVDVTWPIAIATDQ